jgi:hypothetical protein
LDYKYAQLHAQTDHPIENKSQKENKRKKSSYFPPPSASPPSAISPIWVDFKKFVRPPEKNLPLPLQADGCEQTASLLTLKF